MSPSQRRILSFVTRVVCPTLGCLALAFLVANAATRSESLACDRTEGTCRWTRTTFFTSPAARAFPVASVRDVRFVDKLGKHGRQAETVLVFDSGNQFRVAAADHDEAKARHARIAHFFDGHTSTLTDTSEPSVGAFVASVVLVLGALALAIGNTRKWRHAPAPQVDGGSPPPTQPAPSVAWWRRPPFMLATVIGLGGLAQVALLLHASHAQGTLELDCRARCRFQGAECLPGGNVSMALEPGDYTVDVWSPHGEALWAPRTATVRIGERTRFVCTPP